MEIKIGVPVSPGIAIATAQRLGDEVTKIARRFIRKDEVKSETERWDAAKEHARAELEAIKERVKSATLQDEIALIFDTHQKILDDPKLDADIRDRIKIDRYAADHAVAREFRKVINAIKELDDSFFDQRAKDFIDVQRRLLRALTGQAEAEITGGVDEKVIVVAHDLTPSQTATLSTDRVAGFITDLGGSTSHTAIIANALKIPAVVGLGSITADISGGETLIVDGARGRVIVNPDEPTKSKYLERAQEYRDQEKKIREHAGQLKNETADGTAITYLANVEFHDEIKMALEFGAKGLGLYRTEFLYSSFTNPTEEDHFNTYMRSLKEMGNKPVILRTLDFGADKFREELGLEFEDNPFLGNRSIRLCLTNTRLFQNQLRAILRASLHGKVYLMLPMVGSLEELRHAKAEIEFAKNKLREQGIGFNQDIKIGIMVEVPSAAMCARELAQECDFFSIGTNDLVQYTLAVDRNNPTVGHLYQHTHPAVLRLIKQVVDAAKEADIPVSICGEMAGDPILAVLLLGFGITTFSCAPTSIPMLKTALSRVRLERAREIAEEILQLGRVEDINAALAEMVRTEFGTEFEITGKIIKL